MRPDAGQIEVLDQAMADVLRRKTPAERLAIAAMAYGEPRLTNDIDIVAKVVETQIPLLVAAFPAEDYYIRADMIREAIRQRSQFNIIHPTSGLKVDVIIRRHTPNGPSSAGWMSPSAEARRAGKRTPADAGKERHCRHRHRPAILQWRRAIPPWLLRSWARRIGG
jgi:hypothetical protein